MSCIVRRALLAKPIPFHISVLWALRDAHQTRHCLLRQHFTCRIVVAYNVRTDIRTTNRSSDCHVGHRCLTALVDTVPPTVHIVRN